jgi:hypothetical protein
LIAEQKLSATPNVLSFFYNIFLFMVSYAFFKSITAQKVGLRSFFLTSIILETFIKSYNCGIDIGNEKVCILLYADDIVILANNENALQTLLNALATWCDDIEHCTLA